MSSESPGVAAAYRGVLDRLQAGVFRGGTRLPGERALAAELGVARQTLRQALLRLEREGWLASSEKRGWFVRTAVVGEPPNTLLSFTEMAAARGLTARSHILGVHLRPSTFDEAEKLAIVPSASVVEIHRLRLLDGHAICVDRTLVPHALAPGLEGDDLEDVSLYAHLRTHYGFDIARSSYVVHADLLDAANAELLESEPGAATLKASEVTYNAAGTPVVFARLSYRGDAYRFAADLYRP